MRRKTGTLVPLEVTILQASLRLRRDGTDEAYGFQLARVLQDGAGAKRLTAYGTLYRALERLEGFGFLASRWEDPMIALEIGRPPRRFYRLTVTGERALNEALRITSAGARRTSVRATAT